MSRYYFSESMNRLAKKYKNKNGKRKHVPKCRGNPGKAATTYFTCLFYRNAHECSLLWLIEYQVQHMRSFRKMSVIYSTNISNSAILI